MALPNLIRMTRHAQYYKGGTSLVDYTCLDLPMCDSTCRHSKADTVVLLSIPASNMHQSGCCLDLDSGGNRPPFTPLPLTRRISKDVDNHWPGRDNVLLWRIQINGTDNNVDNTQGPRAVRHISPLAPHSKS